MVTPVELMNLLFKTEHTIQDLVHPITQPSSGRSPIQLFFPFSLVEPPEQLSLLNACFVKPPNLAPALPFVEKEPKRKLLLSPATKQTIKAASTLQTRIRNP